MATEVEIGALRWPVDIAQRIQTASGTNTLEESLGPITRVMADVQPIGALTFYAGQQTDRPVTHRIRCRFLDWIDETYVIVRRTQRRDGTTRTEVFRIRRVKEIDGRKRFVEIEAEQESRA